MAIPKWPLNATGQLWQECQFCGAEPIYMPHMVCVQCWPAGPYEPRQPGETFDKKDEPSE